MKPSGKLSHSDWSRVVVVAGIGTVLEWESGMLRHRPGNRPYRPLPPR